MRTALVLMMALSGCVMPMKYLAFHGTVPAPGALIELRWSSKDAAEALKVQSAAKAALPALERWGQLNRPVTIAVLRSHEELEMQIRRRGVPWLQAWARADSVYLQSPRTWKTGGGSESEVTEALTHELTHVLLFQNSGPADAWEDREIPFWFREGMATVTANQGYRFPALEDCARWLEANSPEDLFTNGESLSRTQFQIAYALAHHAMNFLLRSHGEPIVTAIMSAMQEGHPFDRAFENATHTPLPQFESEFTRYLKQRAFRGPFKKQQPTP